MPRLSRYLHDFPESRESRDSSYRQFRRRSPLPWRLRQHDIVIVEGIRTSSVLDTRPPSSGPIDRAGLEDGSAGRRSTPPPRPRRPWRARDATAGPAGVGRSGSTSVPAAPSGAPAAPCSRARSQTISTNKAVKILSHKFNLAERCGLLPECSDPCRSIEKSPERSRERFLTDAEFVRLPFSAPSIPTLPPIRVRLIYRSTVASAPLPSLFHI